MRRRAWGIGGAAMAALLLQGCVSGPVATHKPSGAPKVVRARTGVEGAMGRQAQVARNAELAGTGDWEGDGLRRVVLAEPENVEARSRLAAHYERTGQPELAVEHYRIALGRQRDAAAPRLELVRLLHSLEFREQALKAAEEGIAERATRQLFSWKGILLDELDRAPEGEAAHREALARADGAAARTVAALYNNLGQNLLLQDRLQDAVAAFQKALDRDRRSDAARSNLGMALALSGNAEQALAHWKSLSGPATAHSNLAAVYIEQGKHKEARRELNIALGYNPNHGAALRNLAALSERDGQPAVLEPARVRSGSPWARITQFFRTTLGSGEGRAKAERTQEARR